LPEIERRWGVRLTFTDLIAAATAFALAEIPALNATLEGDLIRRYPVVHLGIAVALDDGLIVPVVRNAAALSLGELAARTTPSTAPRRPSSSPDCASCWKSLT